MSHLPKAMHAFARLLSYPDPRTPEAAELLYVVLQGEMPAAASELAQFGTFLEQHETWQVEEAFTGTFDVNPTCALEVGWHLFGEEYARGMFLVRMREEMRKYALPESAELPDHIAHVLAIIAAMPEDEAERFVKACVQPAVNTMCGALSKRDTPYRHVMASLAAVIQQKWGQSNEAGRPSVLATRASGLDPLHAFPVAAVGCGGGGCGGACGDHDLVELQARLPLANQKTSDSIPNSEDQL